MEKTFEQELNETIEQQINILKNNPQLLGMYKTAYQIEAKYSGKLRFMIRPYKGNEPLVPTINCFVLFTNKFKKSEVKQILNEIIDEFKAMGYTAEYLGNGNLCKDRFVFAKTYATILNVGKFNN